MPGTRTIIRSNKKRLWKNSERLLHSALEDYFMVSAMEPFSPEEAWASKPSRLEIATKKVLGILDPRQVKAAFFTVGWVGGAVLFSRQNHSRKHNGGRGTRDSNLQLQLNKKAKASFFAPFASSLTVAGKAIPSQKAHKATLSKMDCVVIITNHTAFNIADITKHSPLVVDTRNAAKGRRGPNVVQL